MSKIEEFEQWLLAAGKLQKNTIQSVVSRVKRVEKYCDLTNYSAEKVSQLDVGDIVPISGDYSSGVSSLKRALKLFVEFLNVHQLNQENSQQSNSTAVIYKGNKAAFKKFIGPYLRNSVNNFTKKARESCGEICEYCNKKAVLQSAHIEGRERVIIIEEILDQEFYVSDDYYEVDINKFEDLFVAAQMPIEDKFFFICPTCHNAYDKKKTITTEMLLEKRKLQKK